ncbi:nuclear transport factor 2 family protein [Streptomyces achromogenes]|uniref:nuclear transport factor 2 family protein n=1 Tax=Streptomyces achromogenes TaxID=67255 RepID=UPI003405294A
MPSAPASHSAAHRGRWKRRPSAPAAHLGRSRVEGESTQHVHGDVLVRLDGDRAEVTAGQLVYFYRDGEPPHRTAGLRLACVTVRTPAGWRIGEMRITLAWTQER